MEKLCSELYVLLLYQLFLEPILVSLLFLIYVNSIGNIPLTPAAISTYEFTYLVQSVVALLAEWVSEHYKIAK